MMKIIFAVIYIFAISCSDMWTDKAFQIKDSIYIIYSAGNGFDLVKKIGNNNYTSIINTTLDETEIYKTDRILFVKGLPQRRDSDTTYFELQFDKTEKPLQIDKVTFDSLTTGLNKIQFQ